MSVSRVAYLAPEIPALSATFVYSEMLALRDRGIEVVSFSVHRPSEPALEISIDLLGTTHYLYEQSYFAVLGSVVAATVMRFPRVVSAFFLLLADVVRVGLFSRPALSLFLQFFYAFALAKELRTHRIEHLHVHFGHVPTQIGMYASALTGIPFSFTAHANDIFERGILLPQKARRATKLVTISDYNKHYLEQLGVTSDKIVIVRCGVDTYPAPEPMRPVNSPPKIGSLGRLVEKKGMDTLLEACAHIRSQGFDFTLEIAGSGPLEDELKQLSSQLELNDVVSFIGPLRHDLVSQWLRSLDVFGLACKRDKNGDADGIPVVLMEAMANDVPVVSTRITGVPELVRHEATGLLSSPEDSKAFGNLLIRAIRDREARRSMIQSARTLVDEEFSRQVNAERMLGILRGEP